MRNGRYTTNTERKEREQERAQGFCLQQSPSATAGSDDRKERNQALHIRIENSSEDRSFFFQAETTEEVRQELFRLVPSLFCEKLILQFFTEPKGTKNRIPIQGVIPPLQTLYATVCLLKH